MRSLTKPLAILMSGTAAGGCYVTAGGIVAHEKLRLGDLRGEGREGSIVRAHARKQRAFDALALFGAATFVD